VSRGNESIDSTEVRLGCKIKKDKLIHILKLKKAEKINIRRAEIDENAYFNSN
jgi:hypothetical protein